MTKPFMDLSFTFAMDLFRVKRAAESRGDAGAIESLKLHYPEIFADEFQEFIETVKATAEFLDHKYGEDFSSMFSPEHVDIARIIN